MTDVAEYTNSPEILDGRVKTLHPAIHGGLLARDTEADRADLKRVNAEMIDLVAVNLYPFQETIAKPNVTLDDAIENIDIGGVALIRARRRRITSALRLSVIHLIMIRCCERSRIIKTQRSKRGDGSP